MNSPVLMQSEISKNVLWNANENTEVYGLYGGCILLIDLFPFSFLSLG